MTCDASASTCAPSAPWPKTNNKSHSVEPSPRLQRYQPFARPARTPLPLAPPWSAPPDSHPRYGCVCALARQHWHRHAIAITYTRPHATASALVRWCRTAALLPSSRRLAPAPPHAGCPAEDACHTSARARLSGVARRVSQRPAWHSCSPARGCHDVAVSAPRADSLMPEEWPATPSWFRTTPVLAW